MTIAKHNDAEGNRNAAAPLSPELAAKDARIEIIRRIAALRRDKSVRHAGPLWSGGVLDPVIRPDPDEEIAALEAELRMQELIIERERSAACRSGAETAAPPLAPPPRPDQTSLAPVRGPKPDGLWPEVVGWAAGWVAANGPPDALADLERVIADKLAERGKEAGETQIGKYAGALVRGYNAYMATLK